MQTRSGQDRRKRPHEDREEPEIRKIRAFDWTKLLLPHAPLILKIIPLLTIGAAGTIAAPKVYQAFNGDAAPIAQGETVVPEELPPQLKQSLESFDAAIIKLQAEIKAMKNQRYQGDAALAKRVEQLERHH